MNPKGGLQVVPSNAAAFKDCQSAPSVGHASDCSSKGNSCKNGCWHAWAQRGWHSRWTCGAPRPPLVSTSTVGRMQPDRAVFGWATRMTQLLENLKNIVRHNE